jgi:hypothetical protein
MCQSYKPKIPSFIDQNVLVRQVSDFFNLPLADVRWHYERYRILHDLKRYSDILGERKTLCFEEAFIIYVILACFRPPTIVEIGTQYGKSTRRIIDIKDLMKTNSRVICYDVVDEVKHFTPDEAQLILNDVTHTFRQDVLGAYAPGMIYLDAHPYHLLKNVISEFLSYPGDCILAIHDCSRGLCNPNMTLSRDELNITSNTGVWERHVLAEIFGVKNPMSDQLDDIYTSTHHLKVFGTPHGLAVIQPKRLLRQESYI